MSLSYFESILCTTFLERPFSTSGKRALPRFTSYDILVITSSAIHSRLESAPKNEY